MTRLMDTSVNSGQGKCDFPVAEIDLFINLASDEAYTLRSLLCSPPLSKYLSHYNILAYKSYYIWKPVNNVNPITERPNSNILLARIPFLFSLMHTVQNIIMPVNKQNLFEYLFGTQSIWLHEWNTLWKLPLPVHTICGHCVFWKI